MKPTGEESLCGATLFHKFIFPLFFVGLCLAWMIGVTFFSGTKGNSPSPRFGLLIMTGGLPFYILYDFPLKRVWLGGRGLRVSNFRVEIVVPFAAIESVTQVRAMNPRYVVVRLRQDTIFGRRFTFVPKNPKIPWPFSWGEDDVVVGLRDRVAAAQGAKTGKAPGAPVARPGRSVMADDELDGPF